MSVYRFTLAICCSVCVEVGELQRVFAVSHCSVVENKERLTVAYLHCDRVLPSASDGPLWSLVFPVVDN